MNRLLIIVACLLLLGCSTKKNTWTSRAYHNVTSEFNVKFNGYESFKEGVKKAEAFPATDYNELLPVFVFSYDGIAKQVTSEMDRTIDKCTKLITLHSITVKPKKPTGKVTREDREFYNQREFNSVIDDAYLLSAKASLYLQKYDQAITLLDYMLLEFPKASAIPEAKIWLAVALTNMNELDRVEKLLSEANANNSLSKANRANLHAAYANFYIKNSNIKEAANELTLALNEESHKANKIRYHFILANLYSQLNQPAEATLHLEQIIRSSTDFEQEFSARLLLAGSFEPSKAAEMRKNLLKLLKEPKNEDFADRIYFALAKVEHVMGNDSVAIAYLELTVKTESLNPRQNGLAYEVMGYYYYDHQQYPMAYDYLSKAAEELGADYPRYPELWERSQSLKKLAVNWLIVYTEDSLQRVAQLPEAEREKIITNAISKVMEDERQAAAEQQQRQYHANRQEQQRYSSSGNTGGKWYFYNTNSINSGQAAFTMRWGKRRLEDDWRRKDRSEMTALSNAEETKLSDTTKALTPLSNKSREYYTRNLPLTPESMKTSNDRLRPALFRLGEAYMNDVKMPREAINSFEELLKRFPNNEFLASTYYYLYQLYAEAGNTGESGRYKQLLIANFPKEPITQIITNPNYLQEQKAVESQIEAMYAEALNAYNEGRYAESSALAGKINEQYPQNLIQSQIALLRAFCTAKTASLGVYKQALVEISFNYPTSEASKKATELLAALETNVLQYTPSTAQQLESNVQAGESGKASESLLPDKVIYTPSEGTHYFAILFNSKQNANELLFAVESYNVDHFLDKNYDVSISDIGNNYSVLLVKTFASEQEATDYALGIYDDEALILFDPVNFRRILITPENLELLTKTKAVVDYLDFFNTQYLTFTNGVIGH